MPRLPPESIQAYNDEGFLIVPGAASPEEAARLKAEVLRILVEDAVSKASDPRYQSTNRQYRFAVGLHLRSPAILAYVRSEALRDIAQSLLGPDAELQFSSTITKSPGKHHEVDWHQDAIYERDGHGQRLICWTSLTDANPENGGLSVLPRSHRDGLIPHVQSPRNEFNKVAQTDISSARPVILRAGDVLVIHPLLVHGSPQNRTGFDRVALMSGYQKPKREYSDQELKLRAAL